ncbi:Amino acid/auxin permease, partial [Globisporangium splendens]
MRPGSSTTGARAEAKKTPRSAVSDRLHATEDALKAAQATIARQEKCEKELRALLVSNGVAHDATQRSNPAVMVARQGAPKSALIQNLRKSMCEHELVAVVLKQALQEKVPEFQDSKALVNEFVIKKTIGGPLRFRPKTREELESDVEQLNEKYKRVLGNLRQVQQEAQNNAKSGRSSKNESDDEEDDGGFGDEEADTGDCSAPPQGMFCIVQDQLERKKHKIALLQDRMSQQHLEVVRLVHEKEVHAEKCVQLQEELQFLRDSHVDDVSSRDQERLEQFELIQRLRARELELQSEIEEQQRKWSSDRTAIHQQIRLLEKEAQLAEDGKKHAETERAALQKRNDALERQKSNLQEQLEAAEAAKVSLSDKVKELEAILAKHESMSREQLDALTTATAEKLQALQQLVDEKDAATKSAERQLNAAKLLVRQSKKEKEQAQDRLHKLQEELQCTQKVQLQPEYKENCCASEKQGEAMMAFGDDPEGEQLLRERLLGNDSENVRDHLPSHDDGGGHDGAEDTMTMSDDEYELISQRETLVFDDAFYSARKQYNNAQGSEGGESFFKAYLMNKIQPGSVKGSMFTMTVAIVGAGVLALPYAVEQAGLLLGILMITGGALITNFSLRLLLACSELGQARSYMDLAHGTGGARLAGFTQFIVCLNLFGTSVGYLVGSAELIQLAMTSFLGPTSHSVFVDRQALIVLLCSVFVLPLALFRSLESLRFSSLFSIVCIVFMALVIVIKYFQFVHLGLAPDIPYQLHHLTLFDWRLERLLTAFPLVIFVYTCHPNVLPIYLVLKRRSSRRMYKVMNRSIGIAAAVYALCGAFVVLTFGEHTKSNFLKNDYHGDGAVLVGCIGFSTALILTVPLFIHTLRDNIREVCAVVNGGRNAYDCSYFSSRTIMKRYHPLTSMMRMCLVLQALMSNRRLNVFSHALLSTLLVVAVLGVALGSGDIASVLGVLGATTNPVICFVLPAFFIYRLGVGDRHRAHKGGAILLAIVTSILSFLSLLQQLRVLSL